jgi:hypothetical protein
MYSLKPIARAAIPAALQKAEHYRLLNDSAAAESICLDVLEVEPDHQPALITLLLAITDQIADDLSAGVTRARAVLPRLRDEYHRQYYARGKAQARHHALRATEVAAGWLREAMEHYGAAEAIRPRDNDEAILRWNTCARALNRMGQTHQPLHEEYEPSLE